MKNKKSKWICITIKTKKIELEELDKIVFTDNESKVFEDIGRIKEAKNLNKYNKNLNLEKNK